MSEALAAVYARIPAIDCKGLCARSCGPVIAELAEAEATGGEYEVISRAEVNTLGGRQPLGAGDGEGDVAFLAVDRKLRCKLLDLRTSRCTVYENRPGVCRLWGVVRSMPCHMGCEPERWLTHEEGHEILDAIREAAGAS